MGKMLGILAGGAVIIGGLWWFFGRPDTSPETMMKKDEAPKRDEVVMDKTLGETENTMVSETGMNKSDAMMMSEGKYVEYDSHILEENKSTKRVLFFYASWCPFCKPADAEFREKMSEIPEGVTVIRVNYNDPDTDRMEKDLATKYGVTYQHTFVQIDQNDTVVTQWNGGKLAELFKNIK